MDYSMVGPALSLGFGCVGSSIGCYIAGAASHAAMARVEEGQAKFIGMSAAPASQSIYGFILMLLMANAIKGGTLSPENGIAIAISSGIQVAAGGSVRQIAGSLPVVSKERRADTEI